MRIGANHTASLPGVLLANDSLHEERRRRRRDEAAQRYRLGLATAELGLGALGGIYGQVSQNANARADRETRVSEGGLDRAAGISEGAADRSAAVDIESLRGRNTIAGIKERGDTDVRVAREQNAADIEALGMKFRALYGPDAGAQAGGYMGIQQSRELAAQTELQKALAGIDFQKEKDLQAARFENETRILPLETQELIKRQLAAINAGADAELRVGAGKLEQEINALPRRTDEDIRRAAAISDVETAGDLQLLERRQAGDITLAGEQGKFEKDIEAIRQQGLAVRNPDPIRQLVEEEKIRQQSAAGVAPKSFGTQEGEAEAGIRRRLSHYPEIDLGPGGLATDAPYTTRENIARAIGGAIESGATPEEMAALEAMLAEQFPGGFPESAAPEHSTRHFFGATGRYPFNFLGRLLGIHPRDVPDIGTPEADKAGVDALMGRLGNRGQQEPFSDIERELLRRVLQRDPAGAK